MTQWLAGGPNLSTQNAAQTLTPNILPSDWSHPSSQQPKLSVANTAAAAPRDQPVSPSQNPNIPVAAPAGESTSVTQPAENIRNNVALNVTAFIENEEFGLLRPNPTSPAGATGQVGPRPRASQTDGLARQGLARAESGRGEENESFTAASFVSVRPPKRTAYIHAIPSARDSGGASADDGTGLYLASSRGLASDPEKN